MAVTKIGVKRDSRDGAIDNKGDDSFVVVWQIITNNKADTTEDAANGAWNLGLPHRGDPYSATLPGVTARSIRFAQGELPTIWFCTIKYSSAQEESPDEEDSDDPLARPPKISTSPVISQEPFIKDADDNPVLNSAGKQFDPLPTKTVYNTQITIVRNELIFDDMRAERLMGNLNSGEFRGRDPKTVRLTGASGQTQFFRHPQTGVESTYATVTYTLVTGQSDTREILDVGWMVLDDGGKEENALDENKEAVREKILLDGNGKKTQDPHFREFKEDDGEGFDELNLPS